MILKPIQWESLDKLSRGKLAIDNSFALTNNCLLSFSSGIKYLTFHFTWITFSLKKHEQSCGQHKHSNWLAKEIYWHGKFFPCRQEPFWLFLALETDVFSSSISVARNWSFLMISGYIPGARNWQFLGRTESTSHFRVEILVWSTRILVWKIETIILSQDRCFCT